LLAPALFLLFLAFALPLFAIIPEAFSGNFIGRFLRIFGSPVYLTVIWTTVRISLEVTAITLIVSFPFAWLLSRATGVKALMLGLFNQRNGANVLLGSHPWTAWHGQRDPPQSRADF